MHFYITDQFIYTLAYMGIHMIYELPVVSKHGLLEKKKQCHGYKNYLPHSYSL